MTPLTDKAEHGYCEAYEEILGPVHEDPIELLELGTWRSGGLEGWAQWMPEAKITGVDVEPLRFLDHPRIWLVKCNVLSFAPDRHYDVIIDDIHDEAYTPDAFEQLWPWLKPGGHYFLEDQTSPTERVKALGGYEEVAPFLLHFRKEG